MALFPAEHVDSWYRDTSHAAPVYERLRGSVRADVCVVGGGYTGLSAALILAEKGHRVVLLEGARIGFGASGRNGGQIVYGLAPGADQMKRLLGLEHARALFDLCEEAKTLLVSRCERYGIDCDLTWGYVYAAAKNGHLPHLRHEADILARDFGYQDMQFLDRGALQNYVRSPRFPGALYDPHSGHLHPLKYALGLGRAAREAGVQIYEGSPAIEIERGRPVCLRTPEGEVTADWAILAINAFPNRLAPEIASRIMPVGTYIGATEILGEEKVKALIPQDVAVCDSNFVLDYFRRSPDHRLLFGGRVSYSTFEPPRLKEAMRRRALRTFPQLGEVKIEKAWGGFADITMNRLPHIGRLRDAPNILYAQGFSGHGVAITGIAGQLMAEAAMGQTERFDLMAKIRHRPFPGGRLMRMPLLVLAMAWYRLRDYL